MIVKPAKPFNISITTKVFYKNVLTIRLGSIASITILLLTVFSCTYNLFAVINADNKIKILQKY